MHLDIILSLCNGDVQNTMFFKHYIV